MAQAHDNEEARKLRVAASKQFARKKFLQEQEGKTFDQDEHGAGVIPEHEWRNIPKDEPNKGGYQYGA